MLNQQGMLIFLTVKLINKIIHKSDVFIVLLLIHILQLVNLKHFKQDILILITMLSTLLDQSTKTFLLFLYFLMEDHCWLIMFYLLQLLLLVLGSQVLQEDKVSLMEFMEIIFSDQKEVKKILYQLIGQLICNH